MEFNHFSHDHVLVFHQMPQGSKIGCSGCKFTGLGNAYVCWECNHFLHEQCFQATQSVEHPSHTLHPLTLLPYPTYSSGSFQCNSCNIEGKGFCYTCSQCQFDLHVHCALLPNAKPKDKNKPQKQVYHPAKNTHFPIYPPQNDPHPQNNTYPSMSVNTLSSSHHANTSVESSFSTNHNMPQLFPPNTLMPQYSVPTNTFTDPSSNRTTNLPSAFPTPNPYPSNDESRENAPPYSPQTPNNSSLMSAPPCAQPYPMPAFTSFSTQPNPPLQNYDRPTSAHPFPQSNILPENNNTQMNTPQFPQQHPPPQTFDSSTSAPQSYQSKPNYDHQVSDLHFPPENIQSTNYNPPMNIPPFSKANPHPYNYSTFMGAPPFPPPNLSPKNYRPTESTSSQQNSSFPTSYPDQVSGPPPQPNPISTSSTPSLSAHTNLNPSSQTMTTLPYSTTAETTDTRNPKIENFYKVTCDSKGFNSWPETMTRPDHEHSLNLSCISHDSPTSQEVSFICDVCKNRVHAGALIYYCPECDFGTHLECVTSNENQKSTSVTTSDGKTVNEMKREMELTIARLQIAAEGQKAALNLI